MLWVIFWTVISVLTTTASIVLLGDRSLISGDLFSVKKIVVLLLHWKFILAMTFAVTARLAFIMINSALLKLPNTANNSTTITAFITTITYVFIVAANMLFLGERLSILQGAGCGVIMLGIVLLLR